MNKVILMGRLTRDPETRYSQGNQNNPNPVNITTYTLAVDRRFKREGEQNVDFINCKALGRGGEFAEKYFKKGMQVLVMGRLEIRTYDDPKTNQRSWFTEVILDEQSFTESKEAFELRQSRREQYGQPPPQNAGYQNNQYQQQGQPKPYNEAPAENNVPNDFFIDQELSDDDLPF